MGLSLKDLGSGLERHKASFLFSAACTPLPASRSIARALPDDRRGEKAPHRGHQHISACRGPPVQLLEKAQEDGGR